MKTELTPPLHPKLKAAGLTFSQYVVMFAIGQGVNRPTKLAEVCLVSSAAMTGLLDGLEQRKFLRRSHHEVDRRVSVIELTELGRKTLEKLKG